jgi:hypothetical protein
MYDYLFETCVLRDWLIMRVVGAIFGDKNHATSRMRQTMM